MLRRVAPTRRRAKKARLTMGLEELRPRGIGAAPVIPDVSAYTLTDKDFATLRKLVYNLTGINLVESKRTMLASRLSRRLRALGLSSFSDYCDLVSEQAPNGEEIRSMINAVTTNKTEFFRERHHFDYVADVVLPAYQTPGLLSRRSRSLRVWHAGCSTGQEPYSLAMVIADHAPATAGWDIKLLASDIDTNVLQVARDGLYRTEDVMSIPPDMLRKHVMRGRGDNEGKYQMKQYLRDLIQFRHINLLDEPWPLKPTTYFDIIFCRNVVIYFDKPTQQRLFQRFLQRLIPGGYLFIGHSETLHGINDVFMPLGGTIYQKPLEQAQIKDAA